MSVVTVCIMVLVTVSARTLSAQQDEVSLTFESAISRALGENNQLKASFYSMKKAGWDRANAWLQLLPTASFNSRIMKIDDQTFAERDFRRYLPPEFAEQIPQTVFQTSYFSSFEVTAPIFNAALFNNLSLAKAGHRTARAMNRSTRQNVIFQVMSTYLNVLKSRAVLELQEEYLALSQRNYEKAQRLYNAGRYSKTEALRWKVDWEQQKSTVAVNRSMLRSQETMLKRLLDLDMKQTFTMDDVLPESVLSEQEAIRSMSEDEILALIDLPEEDLIRANAALSAARSNAETSKYLYRNSYATYLPNVSLSYSYGWRENNTIDLDDYSPTSLMVNLSVPVFSSFKNYSAVKSSYYAYKESQETFKDQIKNTRYQLTEAVNRIINLKTQKALAQANARFNERNYRIVEQQKEKGLVSNIDFIDAKLNFQNARLNDVHTSYDLVASIVELYYFLGRIEQFVNGAPVH